MTGNNVHHTTQHSQNTAPGRIDEYDPFIRGSSPVGVRTIQARDTVRDREFPCGIWYPAAPQHAGQHTARRTQDFFTVPLRDTPRSQLAVRDAAMRPGTYPLIVYSHPSSGHRRMATFLCTHLSSHGYVVAALDHSEVVAPELTHRDGESDEQKAARTDAVIASRVPDIRFLLECVLRQQDDEKGNAMASGSKLPAGVPNAPFPARWGEGFRKSPLNASPVV